MKRSTDRILTTHVGSLIRPLNLQEFLRTRQKRNGFDQKAYDECLTASVADIVSNTLGAAIGALVSTPALDGLSRFLRKLKQARVLDAPTCFPVALSNA